MPKEDHIQLNKVLKAINRILQEAGTSRSEEEIGKMALAVAEELTSSRFGFIGELTSEDRMDDMAISNPGWEACKMADPIGHRILPSGLSVYGLYGRVLSEGQGYYTNAPMSHPDSRGLPEGHPTLTAFLGVPLKESGKVIGIVAVGNRPGGYRDVDVEALELLTPSIVQAIVRFRSERALRESEEHKRLAIEIAQIGTWEYDPLTRNSFWDKRSKQFFGLPTDDARVDLKKFFSLVHPQDQTLVKKEMNDSIKNGIIDIQYRIIKADGEERTIHAIGKVYFDSEGTAIKAIGTHVDITDQKRSENALIEREEQLRLFIEHAPAALAMFDRDMRYISVSRRWRTDYNLDDRELVGLCHYEIFPNIPEYWKEAHQRGMAGEVVRNENDRFERAGGSVQWLRWEVRPWRNQSGDVAGIVIFTEDITKRKESEEALKQLNETLEERVAIRTKALQALSVELIESEEQERSRIAGILHEDLQQILVSARMQLQVVNESSPSEPLLENVEKLLEESIAISRSLSHELSPSVLQHSDLVDALQWLALQKRERFGMKVEVEVNVDHLVVETPIKTFLFRAVQELLFNVIKHAHTKSVQIVISRSDEAIAIEVIDQGLGFDTGIIDSAIVKGGLGLRSIRERAIYVGGSLSIDSSPGKGSRFTLTVPITLRTADEPAQPGIYQQNLSLSGRAEASRADGIRVLIVDDHKVVRQGLIHLMSGKPGIQVVGEAANGSEALEFTRKIPPDVVIMDISMPEMDGIEATRRIKAELPYVRVIGLSMHQDDSITQAMLKAGAETVLSKTASSSELLKAIY